jgi:hypothetical protein
LQENLLKVHIALHACNNLSPFFNNQNQSRIKGPIEKEEGGRFLSLYYLINEAARVGIAVSDKATGPYTYLTSYRPNAGFWPVNLNGEQRKATAKVSDFKDWWTDPWRKATIDGLFIRRDFDGGQMSRDMTLYVYVLKDAELAFHSQSTCILPVAGKKDAFIFMADRWTPKTPIDARYIWLPIQFKDGLPVLKWIDKWDLSIFAND